MTDNKTYTIDAKDKILGRVATEAASVLRGKNSVDFQPNLAPKVKVKILNITQIKLSGKKNEQKMVKRYSGYPGGLKETKFSTAFDKNPKQAFRKVIEGMLPKNRLKKQMLKNLIIE